MQLGVARGFERPVPQPDGTVEIIANLPASQRFFAGGGNSVRGFQLDRLGVPTLLNSDGLSNGGNGLVVVNAELRTTLLRVHGHPLGVVGFLDGGNVFAKTGDIDFGQLRTAVGFGLRIDSPLGPLRLDFGFKTDRQIIAGKRERGWEFHLNFGEAF